MALTAACGGDGGEPAPGTTTTTAAADATAELQRLVDDTVEASPSIPGLLVRVESPDLDAQVAAGVADRATGEPLEPDATVRIASNTKTFTAAATLRLVEGGRLGLDDAIAPLLTPALTEALVAGGYQPDVITVRQLLLHTSGLVDYGKHPDYLAAVEADPGRRWTRLEQVQFAMDRGPPLGAPGEVFGYADTGYSLLGDILERTTGTTLGAALRDLVGFDELGLDETWFEQEEDPPAGAAPRAHQYVGEDDGHDVDATADFYGAAGLVSSVDDLAAFYRALLAGDVFEDPATLATMLEIPPTNTDAGMAMGLIRQEVAGEECWGFSGFWGTFALTCPGAGVTFAVSIDQAFPGDDFDGDALLAGLAGVAGLV